MYAMSYTIAPTERLQIYSVWQADNIDTLPHFGKYVPSFMKQDVIDMMQPRIDEFRQLRHDTQLDSIDLFTNDFLDEYIFYDIDRPSASSQNSAAPDHATAVQHCWYFEPIVCGSSHSGFSVCLIPQSPTPSAFMYVCPSSPNSKLSAWLGFT